MIRIAFDSNILLYLAGVDKSETDASKITSIRALFVQIANQAKCVAPQQALGELYSVYARYRQNREEARAVARRFQAQFESVATDESIFTSALDLATDHKLQFWDALILAASAAAGCSLLLSEDMQDGFAWRGVTVVNPFASRPHRALARMLA